MFLRTIHARDIRNRIAAVILCVYSRQSFDRIVDAYNNDIQLRCIGCCLAANNYYYAVRLQRWHVDIAYFQVYSAKTLKINRTPRHSVLSLSHRTRARIYMTHHHNWFRTFPLIMLLYNNASSEHRIFYTSCRNTFSILKQNYFHDITRDKLNRPIDVRRV